MHENLYKICSNREKFNKTLKKFRNKFFLFKTFKRIGQRSRIQPSFIAIPTGFHKREEFWYDPLFLKGTTGRASVVCSQLK